MNWIAFVRHGVTEWNELGRIQGRTDTRLSRAGIEKLEQVRPDADFLQAYWVSSPLRRARHTARLLNPSVEPEPQDALIETHWGDFEGLASASIPQRIRDLEIQPDRGLDLLPPGGESPRMVRARAVAWAREIALHRPKVVAVTHKGVIRSLLSAACDWDMQDDFPEKPDWTCPKLFAVDASGALRLLRLNCPWDQPVACP